MNPTDMSVPRILLVEDDPVSQAFLAAALEALPSQVDRAGTLAAARDLAARHAHALWLVDANLPDGQAADLLAQLRADFPVTPALAHTASQDSPSHDALIEAGFLEVLVKPLSTKSLHAAVGRALGVAAVVPMPTRAKLPSWDDAAALAALSGQPDHVDALRRLFLDELPAQCRGIRTAAANGDHAAMRSTLHRLLASCGFVGAARLGEAVRSLESAPHCTAAFQVFDEATRDLLRPA